MTAIPTRWRTMLHGWDGLDASGLESLAVLAARGGQSLPSGYPAVDRITYPSRRPAVLVQHPNDDGLWLGDIRALDALPPGVDAVVSLCAVGSQQVPRGIEHLTFRLIDREDADCNPNLDFLLADIVATVMALRDDGKTVLVHCVASESRTPTVAIAYSMQLRISLSEALKALQVVLPGARPNKAFMRALRRAESNSAGRL